MKQPQQRLYSIDVFRAVTMFLMIFVNDFDGVQNVPEWMKHAKASEDALGFADIIFPAFLFILGLSIPIAMQNRIKRGQTEDRLLLYILLRSFALLLMGVFQVNLENYSNASLLPRPVWEIIITLAFFLIWIDYSNNVKKQTRYLLQTIGVALLIAMAIVYKGENAQHSLQPLQPQWYGILGLLGWSYFICAPLYLLSKGKVWTCLISWAFFFLFSVVTKAEMLDGLGPVRHYIWIVGSGSMPAFTMAGVVVFVMYKKLVADNKMNQLWLVLTLFGLLNIALGFFTRPLGGISKIHDTPSWIGFCTGISVLAFVFAIYLVDVKQKKAWFNIIKPAGTVTLVCYLIPYILYSLFEVFHLHFPLFLNEGWGGFFRSVVTSLLVIQFAGWLEKRQIRLKI
ncbi:MAG: DUF5009 domain-containing protein [Bacteroidota bacterium]|nr:DUF5009 domain-containing protein [Bacteroidota bacterium]